MHEDDPYPRWQRITIDQFGYTLNLVLTFTVAALGYWFVLLTDDAFAPGSSAKCAMMVSLLGLGAAGICGLLCSYNRLEDFRGTAKRARNGPNSQTEGKAYLDELGRRSWVLLRVQLVAFALGVLFLGVALLLTYCGKLA